MSSYLFGLPFRFSQAKKLCLNTFPLIISVRCETHYDVLKLPRSCTSKDIREAFISLSKENHPDKNQNDPSLHIRFVKINDAYRTLIKPSSRHAYDMTLATKRKLGPPYATTTKASSTYQEEYKKPQPDFNDPFMWHNVQSDKKSNDSYYGIKGIKKVSNKVILWFLFAFTVFGVCLQVFIIRLSYDHIFPLSEIGMERTLLFIERLASTRRNEQMLEESRKNSIIESMLREKAKLYGNEHQIQVLKNSLRATYELDETPEELELEQPKSD